MIIFRPKASISFITSVCLYVHMHETTWLPLSRFSWKMVFQYFLKICQEISSFIESWQE